MDILFWTISAVGILTALVLAVVESRPYLRRHHRRPHH